MRKLTLFILSIFIFHLSPSVANDYLEVHRHYQVYSSGRNSIHFKVPVWARGNWNDYHLDSANTTIRWQVQGEPVQTFMHIGGPALGVNRESNDKGNTRIWMCKKDNEPGTKGGIIVVTNEYNGNPQQIEYTGDWYTVEVKQISDDDCDRVTMVEFDWYPPAELNNKKFKISIQTDIRKRASTSADYHPLFTFSTTFTGGENTAAPQLYTPYLYMVNEAGVAGRGLAAVPYYSQAKPISYTNPLISETIIVNDNSGTMYVPTSDTGYYAFDATFKVYRNEETNDVETIHSNAVAIPAYHRIYNFMVSAQQDEYGSYTGANIVTWNTKYPGAKDLIQGDYFELQRAFKSDFSDAQTVQLMPMKTTDSIYQYVDDNPTVWNGTEIRTDTIDTRLSVSKEYCVLYDADKNPIAAVDCKLVSKKLIKPSAPVYYRVRRTSSSVWDWDHDFAKSYELYKATYLTPLKQKQADYRLDPDFASNRKIHFSIDIDNMEIGPRPLSIDECTFSYTSARSFMDDACVNYILFYNDQVTTKSGNTLLHGAEVYLYVSTKDGQEPYGPRPGKKMSPGRQKLSLPVGSIVERLIRTGQGGPFPFDFANNVDSLLTTNLRDSNLDKVDEIYFDYTSSWFYWFDRESIKIRNNQLFVKAQLSPAMDSILAANEPKLKQELYTKLGGLNGNYGRCMWDRSARLILRRNMEETGQSVDIIIPQDSIIRLEDGSWQAHMVDIADASCTHYNYQVYIDQSNATLRVADSIYLLPKTINGQKFFFNQAASVTSFSASQGDARDKHKAGVQLQWLVNSTAVDSFVLRRAVKNSTDAPEVIYRGEDNHFFDEASIPGTHYEYTVTAYYTCNGNTTTSTRTAEGWRSPYGQISGMVQLPDNAGMAGVQVSLSADGQTLRNITTDATGIFVFDSLSYDLNTGTIYTVTPTSQYGTFSYNNTSSAAASVPLDVNHAIQEAINFVNTSTVRLSGRVLYDLSTIPVADACFVLNGDTVRRGNTIYRTGTDGNFELTVPKSMPCRLRVAKPGHTFTNDGWLFVTGTDTAFSLVKALDGVRFYDTTKVRLVGRVAGGNDQKALKHGFGLGKNNLGDDLQLVLMLEGDNTAHIVHDPDDLSRDTLHRSVSGTDILFEQKRIIIHPDITTGEYAADLFPVKYKVVQATAKGYATLFPSGTGSETFDLTNAPLTTITDSLEGNYVQYNAIYDRIYHNPVQLQMTQLLYGMEKTGYGEESGVYTDMDGQTYDMLLYTEADGNVAYTLGYPVFMFNRQYQFMVSAFEQYCYNNDTQTNRLDRVPIRSGSVTIRNGLHSATESRTYALDSLGRNKSILLKSDNIDFANAGTAALRSVSAALQTEGNTVETDLFQAFVIGDVVQSNTLRSTAADIKILDIVRDPGGMGSSAWIEEGSTYKFGYSSRTQWEVGAEVGIKWGDGVTQSIGVVSAPQGAGTYAGSVFETTRSLTLSVPFTWSWDWTNKYSYDFSTTTRIATSSAYSGVGAAADVYLGTTRSVITGLAKSVSVISDSLWQARQTAYQGGAIKLLAQGTDANGQAFYLVTGEKSVFGSALDNTFAYTQKYVLGSVIPSLARQRLNLLENFDDFETAQTVCNERGEPVYWYKGTQQRIIDTDTLSTDVYEMITPENSDKPYADEVAAINHRILNWINVIYTNEKEKVMARMSGQKYGTYSVSGGTSYTRSDNYSYGASYTEMPQDGLFAYNLKQTGTAVVERATLANLKNMKDFWQSSGNATIGESVSKVIDEQFTNYVKDLFSDDMIDQGLSNPEELEGKTANAKWKIIFEPVLSYTNDEFRSYETSVSRKTGFTLSPDPHGDITVSVYRANLDSVFYKGSAVPRAETKAQGDSLCYAGYVFFTEAGSSYCPYEAEEKTKFYNAGTSVISNGTLYTAKPEMAINTYEQTNVGADKPAVFRLTLMNNADTKTAFAGGEYMTLSLAGGNPDGAKVFIDGVPIAAGYPLYIEPGNPIVKTMEVYRGQADDYNDLELQLSLDDCPKIYNSLKFSVHFMPESSPVSIAYPRDKWVMNTLSARDSMGYYLPITIDGFDIHHKNFDHIEFQYKLSTENNDAWVTQCAFFADDSLYNLASGNKAMIENGRITPFRFYGERDPKELNYDLRAVSFCRYGSGFVTKESPVISGTKDTRPPVLFGKAQPANGILTLEDNISLRFSEPIAGNWLDQDNNFQLLGVTNATGITQSTSLYLGGSYNQYLESDAGRELAITDLTVDMMIRPAETGRDMTLFTHGDSVNYLELLLTADNRLKVILKDDDKDIVTLQSKPMAELSKTDFTRVIMVYDFWEYTVRFYAGTLDITDQENDVTPYLLQNNVHTLRFGKSLFSEETIFKGNMMEIRLWTKALTPDEIANTHLRRLTGYEHELMDYYPMNEGNGSDLTDLASGATLHGDGLSWTNPQGISVALEGEPVELNPLYFSRTAAQDYTLMGWFRSENSQEDAFSIFATALADSITMEIGHAGGRFFFRQDDINTGAIAAITDGEWHHVALSVSKSYNVGTLYLDGNILQTFPVHTIGALSGTKISVGNGLIGNFDDICLFEQALPASLIQEYMRATPNGDEMGLIALLPFSEIKRNSANVMELVFSVNDQRVFHDANGNIINKVVPLVNEQMVNDKMVNELADKANYAPVVDRGQLTNLNFTWSYQDDELLINLNMQEREINKRSLYLTVRDVEDLNGNRLVSPVSWSVYADLNSLRWSQRRVDVEIQDNEMSIVNCQLSIINTTGMTRQFTIDNLPEWLECSPKQGTLGPKDEERITFTVKKGLSPGKHNAVVFLTDDKGLSESLVINIDILSICPWDDIDPNRYKQNMSLRAQVFINQDGTQIIDSDREDIVGIFCNGELVGKGQISGEDFTRGYVYITVYGDASLNGRMLTAQLWRQATAKTYLLSSDQTLRFKENSCLGCSPNEPVRLSTSDAMMQAITLNAGWTWTSFYLIPDKNGMINSVLMADSDFDANDEIKSPATGNFCRYNDSLFLWQGPLSQFYYRYVHMFYTEKEHTIYVAGTALQTEEDRTIPLKKGWNVFPYLRMDNKNLRDALSPYYAYATEGDMIKSHDEFAVFSANGKWEGNLTYLQPGRGYFFFRQAESQVSFTFPASSPESNAPDAHRSPLTAHRYATNMTMICQVEGDGLRAYIGNELVGVAEPLTLQGESEGAYYFLTISSDAVGALRFETENGEALMPIINHKFEIINYIPDAHHGSLKSPIFLRPTDNRPYKIIENNHVIIIRNNEKYDITGKKL